MARFEDTPAKPGAETHRTRSDQVPDNVTDSEYFQPHIPHCDYGSVAGHEESLESAALEPV